MLDHSEYEASCAVCGSPAEGECSSGCESIRLNIAIDRAEAQWLEKWREKTREWVANNAIRYVTGTFTIMKEARLETHRAYIRALPYWNVYEQYQGRPPIHPHYVANLRQQIHEADIDLRRNIDADWKSCVIRYPEVLTHYYNQINIANAKSPEPPPGFSASFPRFTVPSKTPTPSQARSTTGSMATQKKQRRNSKTVSAKVDKEASALASMYQQLQEQGPATFARTGVKLDRFSMPQVPEPPTKARSQKRLSKDFSFLGHGGGAPQAPMAPLGPLKDPYRPEGGRFG